jgi:hypothetical protein
VYVFCCSFLHTLLIAALMMMLAGVVLLTVQGNNSVRRALCGHKSSRTDCWHNGTGIFSGIGTLGRLRRPHMLPVSVDAHAHLLVLDYCTNTGEAAEKQQARKL